MEETRRYGDTAEAQIIGYDKKTPNLALEETRRKRGYNSTPRSSIHFRRRADSLVAHKLGTIDEDPKH